MLLEFQMIIALALLAMAVATLHNLPYRPRLLECGPIPAEAPWCCTRPC
jgi:hypothetical protein